jgi:hypothetical protein
MSEVIRVQAARIPDRDRLVALLTDHGHDARPVDDIEIDVHCNVPGGGCAPAVYERAEDAVMEIGDAFVPVKHGGVIYVRPPVG